MAAACPLDPTAMGRGQAAIMYELPSQRYPLFKRVINNPALLPYSTHSDPMCVGSFYHRRVISGSARHPLRAPPPLCYKEPAVRTPNHPSTQGQVDVNHGGATTGRETVNTDRAAARTTPSPPLCCQPPFEAACARADRALVLIAKYGEPRLLPA